jgi:ribose transport system ATP-binding protein
MTTPLLIQAPAPAGSATPPLLRMQGITKRFGGTLALNQVSLDVQRGSIVALLGENGAGKSTLIKVLAGVYPQDQGEILFKGQPVQSAQALRNPTSCPISFIHQDLGLVEWMTVAENIALTVGFPKRAGCFIDWAGAARKARKALALIGIDIDPEARIFELSRAEKALVAIARALVVDAELIVLDEPTASLPAADVAKLFTILERLRASGLGMIYVSHRLDEIKALSDQVVVLRDGARVDGGATCDYSPNDLVRMIVGCEKTSCCRRPRPTGAEVVCAVDQLAIGGVGPVSFTIQRGELLAIAGLRGAGQVELGRCLFGCLQRSAGRITFQGREVHFASPGAAIAAGVSLVGSDRMAESLGTGMSVAENLFINPSCHGEGLFGYRSLARETAAAQALAGKFDIRPAAPAADIEMLSGGNQQKVVIARWLDIGAPLLILEDPTAGVDVGSRAEIYRLLNLALAQGVAVLVISTDFEEIAKISNRALVFNRGQMVRELLDEEVTFENLLMYASTTQGTAPGAKHPMGDTVK